MRFLLLFLGAFAAAAAPLTLTLSRETNLPGGTVQIKLYTSRPQIVASGEISVGLDPKFFGSPTSIVPLSADGLGSGYAYITTGAVDIHFFDVGGVAGLPILAITVPVLPGIPVDTTVPVTADLKGSTWTDPSANAYSVTVVPGSVTVGGTLSVQSVTPSAGPIAAGGVLKIAGKGFSDATTVEMPAVAIALVHSVSAQEVDVVLAGAADIGGKQITVRNPDGSRVDFFGAVNAPPVPLPPFYTGDLYTGAVPLFPTIAYPQGLNEYKDNPGWYALANPGTQTVEAKVYGIPGGTDITGFPALEVTIPPGGVYFTSHNGSLLNIAEIVIASGPLQMMGISRACAWWLGTCRDFVGPMSPLAGPGTPASFSPNVGTLLNAASGVHGAIAPGEMVSLHGSALSDEPPLSYDPSSGRPVPVFVGGAVVLIDGNPVPLLYNAWNQINAVIPSALANESVASVEVRVDNVSTKWSVPVASAAPGIFTSDGSGAGQAAVLNSDNSVNGVDHPASRGSQVQIFATGIAHPESFAFAVTIGGFGAQIISAGPSGALPGLIQINAVVPENTAPGAAVPIVLAASSIQSPPGVSIAVN